MNILFTCAGRRRYLLKYFKEQLNGGGLIVAADMQLSAPALSVADAVEQVPSVYDSNYVDTILGICKKHHIDLLISLNDLELPVLAARKADFEANHVILLVSPLNVIDICFDKWKTANYILSLGLKTPKTFVDYQEAIQSIHNDELKFPLVLKPRWGSGSIGIESANDLEEMSMVYALLQKRIKKSILSETSQGENYILIQEKIVGQEYGIDVMNDLNGNFQAVSVKRKIAMRAGETDKAITVDNPQIREIGRVIGENLKHIANLDCDILERNGEYFVLELNPRFGGGFPFSYEAGVNMPEAIIEWAKGNKIDPGKLLQPAYSKAFAKCDILVEVH